MFFLNSNFYLKGNNYIIAYKWVILNSWVEQLLKITSLIFIHIDIYNQKVLKLLTFTHYSETNPYRETNSASLRAALTFGNKTATIEDMGP